jgi:hypothetical protein
MSECRIAVKLEKGKLLDFGNNTTESGASKEKDGVTHHKIISWHRF